jgi:quinol monooxygenase YgiN
MTTRRRRIEMILSTAKIEDFDQWWNAFSTKGAEKRREHGCQGSHVFRDPDDDHRVWVVFDWDEEGFRNFVSDPEMVEVFEVGGMEGKPQAAEFVRQHDA